MQGSRGDASRVGLIVAICLALPALVSLGCNPSPHGETQAARHRPPPGLEYTPPPPGSYALPPIQEAVDGTILDADGVTRRLLDYTGDKVVLLSFVYTSCADGKGCPLATAVFHMVAEEMDEDPELRDNLRLVTLSFDPERDTPQVMREYVADKSYLDTPWDSRPWALLTSAANAEIEPILEGFGQFVVREIDENGEPTDRFTHVLKVFLIDRERQVRNIYSSSFLRPRVAINDVKTILLQEDGRSTSG